MYLNCNYPIFTDFFIVKATQTIQYASYNQYYYGDLDLQLNSLKSIHIDITSHCSNIFKLNANHDIKAANKLFKLFV
jgi:hypothetical protein